MEPRDCSKRPQVRQKEKWYYPRWVQNRSEFILWCSCPQTVQTAHNVGRPSCQEKFTAAALMTATNWNTSLVYFHFPLWKTSLKWDRLSLTTQSTIQCTAWKHWRSSLARMVLKLGYTICNQSPNVAEKWRALVWEVLAMLPSSGILFWH